MRNRSILACRRGACNSTGLLFGRMTLAVAGAPSRRSTPTCAASLSPIGDTERRCNVSALPPNVESVYHEFMAG